MYSRLTGASRTSFSSMSPTTPTISQVALSATHQVPNGVSAGKKKLAKDAFTTTTLGAVSLSRRSKSRPRRRCAPTVWK